MLAAFADKHGITYSLLSDEGTVRFSLPLTFTEKVGDQTIATTIRYQACSATDCLIPQAVELRVPLSERNNV